MRDTLQRHSSDLAESNFESRRASMGQELIRPADLISWARPHHNSQCILHCVALAAVLLRLYGTNLESPAGGGLAQRGASLGVSVCTTGLSTKHWGNTRLCQEGWRKVTMQTSQGGALWRRLPRSSCVASTSWRRVGRFFGSCKAFWVDIRWREGGCKPSWSLCSTAWGGCVSREPALPRSAAVLPPACRTRLPTEVKHGTFSKTHTPLIFLILKKVDTQGSTNLPSLGTGAAITF